MEIKWKLLCRVQGSGFRVQDVRFRVKTRMQDSQGSIFGIDAAAAKPFMNSVSCKN